MLDIIVVGGGHAGVEAALACARMNMKTALVSISIDMIASMPCNPSVGGPAKGIVVREIDALGGEMGKAADRTALQFKMLNLAKGPGVQSLRVQSDKMAYKRYMQDVCLHTENLEVIEKITDKILFEDGKAVGVRFDDGEELRSKAVIVTTGTYMTSNVLVGHTSTMSGPDDQPTNENISQSLRDAGLKTFRLKTGTPARVYTDSIDFSKTELQPGTDDFICFSQETRPEDVRAFKDQAVCYLTYTAPETHRIIRDNLGESAMYSGLVKGVGPRYCPSIEDKLVRFADKERHQIFLEPESDELDTTYIQGFSTSMPHHIQDLMLHSLPGLENCRIKKYAYAIEYDAIDPLQLKPTLEVRSIENLFCAGQINGTSGYEEAAAQGLMAGINASLKLQGKEGLVLARDEAYIGVMIDDLVTKGTQEPYRLLTSRAEYRLLLRHDNAEERLSEKGFNAGLLSKERYQKYLDQKKAVEEGIQALSEIRFTPKSGIVDYLKQYGYEPLHEGISALELLKRPHMTLEGLKDYLPMTFTREVAKQIEIETKYEGYIKKARKEADKLHSMEKLKLHNVDYDDVDNLSIEGRQKLKAIQPFTLGQASRISGVNPADIAVLAVYIKQRKNK